MTISDRPTRHALHWLKPKRAADRPRTGARATHGVSARPWLKWLGYAVLAPSSSWSTCRSCRSAASRARCSSHGRDGHPGLLGSLLLTLTVIPALAATALGLKRKPRSETILVRWVRAGYTPVLCLFTRHPLPVVLGTIAIFAVSVVLARGLGGEFLPQLSEGSIVVTSEKLPGINLDASLRTVTAIKTVVRGFPEVTRVVSLTGSAAMPTDPMGVESTESFVSLKPRSVWNGAAANQDDLAGQIEKALKDKVPAWPSARNRSRCGWRTFSRA